MVRELVKTGYVPVLEIFGIFRKLPLLLVLSRNAWFSVTLNSYFAVKLFLSRVKIFSPFRKTLELCKCWYYINRWWILKKNIFTYNWTVSDVWITWSDLLLRFEKIDFQLVWRTRCSKEEWLEITCWRVLSFPFMEELQYLSTSKMNYSKEIINFLSWTIFMKQVFSLLTVCSVEILVLISEMLWSGLFYLKI